MRILVVGAGAVGGYFGGRLAAIGRDVTFLVRPARAARMAAQGLVIRSPQGDLDLPAPQIVTADRLSDAFDLVLLSCKAYDLDDAIDAVAPAIGPQTAILPLLNGMRHIDRLAERFGAERVLGGLCAISSELDAEGRIRHLNDLHALSYGERDGTRSARVEAIAEIFSGANFSPRLSPAITQDMWEKWVLIASLAGITTLMRAPIGAIVAAGGAATALALYDECAAIAAAAGFAPSAAAQTRISTLLRQAGSPMTASMLRDIESGARIEADQIIGDLLRRGGGEAGAFPLLRLININLQAYLSRRGD